MRFLFSKTYVIGAFAALTLVCTPAPAQADVVDDLIVRVQSMMEEMAKIQAQLQMLKQTGVTTAATPQTATAAPAGSVLGASTFSFTQETVYGATNDDVKKIQELLATDPEIYKEGITSGFFGPATQRAIKNLQTRFGLDPVGVVGPATTALLERLISQQNSDGTYPSDILDPTRPTGSVAGVTTSNTSGVPSNIQAILDQVAALQKKQTTSNTTANTKTTTTVSSNSGDIEEIVVEVDDGESLVRVFYNGSDDESFWLAMEDEDDIVEELADRLGISEASVSSLIDWEKRKSNSKDDADDIDEIRADVDVEDGETAVEVEYEDGDVDDFDVDEYDYEDIIEAIADELDIDEDDVIDLIEFDWNVDVDDIDEINVRVEDDEAEVTVELESGDEFELFFEEDDEDDLIEEIADMLDIDEDDVEDLADFDFID